MAHNQAILRNLWKLYFYTKDQTKWLWLSCTRSQSMYVSSIQVSRSFDPPTKWCNQITALINVQINLSIIGSNVMGSFVVFILCIYCLYVCPTIISVNFCYGVCSIYTTIYFFLMRDKNINLQDSNQQLVVQSVADPKSSQQLPTTINICTNTCEIFKLYECFTVIYFDN